MLQIVAVIISMLFIASVALAAGVTDYQVTGPVVEVKDDKIVVEKTTGSKKEKWEIAKDKDTKIKGDVKVGSKVTVKYTMKAVSVEAKEEGKKAETKKDEKKKEEKKK